MQHLKNFTQYENENGLDGILYLKSEDGLDFYASQELFQPDSLKILYDKNGKISVITKDITAVAPLDLSILEMPSDTDVSLNNYILNGAITTAPFNILKSKKISEINAKSEAVIGSLVNEQIPAFEMQTWNAQSAEAKAFKKDETAPTPTLDLIALNRGIDRVLLIKKAYKKATALEQATAVIVGQRQKLQDMVEAAKTLADLEKIKVEFKLS